MQTMKAAKYYSSNKIEIEELPVPKIKRGEILVKVKACGICGSDVAEYYMKPKAPTFFGHEPAGVVREVGGEVDNLKVGDRVFVHHHVPCFTCDYCQRGSYTMCPLFKKTNIYPGGFSQYIRVPALNVQRDTLKLPSNVSFEEATLIEPIGCCIKGIKKANIQVGDRIAIIGAGFMGLVHNRLARLLGATLITAIDFVDFRLKKALEFGADYVINPNQENVLTKFKQLNEGKGADVVIVTSGSVKAIEEGVKIAGKGSTLYLFAPSAPGSNLAVDLQRFFFSEITLVTSYSASPLDTRAALKLIQSKRINSNQLITHLFSLEQINDAMQLVARAGESLKVVIVPD